MKKYLTILCDGMADRDDDRGLTPMDEAYKPNMDALCEKSLSGIVKTTPSGMKPGSDICNLAALGYEPENCYTGRSPLEALSIGIDLGDDDATYRVNLVTLSGEDLDDMIMADYSAGEISTEEAEKIIDELKPLFISHGIELYAGVSYRHAAVIRGGKNRLGTELTPPHDFTGKPIADRLPKGEHGDLFRTIIAQSHRILKDSQVNVRRIAQGKNPASAVWFWGEGTRPSLRPFKEMYGKSGAVISAVDLVKGIGKGGGMTVIDIPTATGTVNTDYAAKTNAAINAFKTHDFVFMHFEGPDECGHQGDRKNKILSIERIDKLVLKPLLSELKKYGDFAITVMPDHATPLCVRTHTNEPVPFFIYDSALKRDGIKKFTEKTAASTGVMLDRGCDVIKTMFGIMNLD